MGWNLVFALINAVIATAYSSYWYLTISALYLLLGLMKLSVLSMKHRKRQMEKGMLKETGIAMFALAVVLSGMMVLTIRELRNPVKNKIVMIANAMYAFTYITIAVISAVKEHRRKSAVLIALRNISCAGAIISMISLERSMLGTFGNPAGPFALYVEAGTGAAAFLLLLVLGIDLLKVSKEYRK